MNLTPLTKKTEIKAAYAQLVKSLRNGATRHRCVVGWKGGSDVFTVYWHEEAGFWVLFNVGDAGGYWCPFGSANPAQNMTVSITCEINPPNEGVNRRKGGVLLRDSGSGLYLAHTGKISGGREGIGKAAFLERYSGSREEIEWPDGETTEVVLLGRIGGRSFINAIGHYIHAVDAFKAKATGQAPSPITEKYPDLSFNPEFEGPKKKYKLTTAIESQCDHGTVVGALHQAVTAFGIEPYNTGMIDLYLADSTGRITHLFEVKTDQTTASLYQAVGQAMLHGVLEEGDPQRILVLPGELSADTAGKMKRLGIRVVRYEWKGSTPVFDGLKKALS
jgi:hypothetical protein